MVFVAVVASFTPLVVVVTCVVLVAAIVGVVVVVVADTRSASASLDGVLGIAVRPEPAHGCRRCRPGPFSMVLMPGGGGFGPSADGPMTRPRSDRWCEAELSACCAAAASSSILSC
jgi:hypothetical protein